MSNQTIPADKPTEDGHQQQSTICLEHSPLETILVARALVLCSGAGFEPTFTSDVNGDGSVVTAQIVVQQNGEKIARIDGKGQTLPEACFRLCVGVEAFLELLAHRQAQQDNSVLLPGRRLLN